MARRKITDIEDLAATADDLPDLTDQQMTFVRHMLAGKSATEAYKLSYDVSTMSPNCIWGAASTLRHHKGVSKWLHAARTAALGAGVVTLEGHIAELERLREIAIASGNVGAAVQAEQIRGKAQGLHVDRIADVTEQFDPTRTLQDIARTAPDLAASLAAEHGIEWSAGEGVTKH
jgi:hypothetical protein